MRIEKIAIKIVKKKKIKGKIFRRKIVIAEIWIKIDGIKKMSGKPARVKKIWIKIVKINKMKEKIFRIKKKSEKTSKWRKCRK